MRETSLEAAWHWNLLLGFSFTLSVCCLPTVKSPSLAAAPLSQQPRQPEYNVRAAALGAGQSLYSVCVCASVSASLARLHMNNRTSDEDDCIAIGALSSSDCPDWRRDVHRCVKQAFKLVKRYSYREEKPKDPVLNSVVHIWNLKPKSHPVEGVMMQPPRSTVILQPHPRSGVSWFMPKLCPSSCANVTAAPSGFSEWSFGGKQKGTLEHVNLLHSNICEPLFTHCENKPQWNAVKTFLKNHGVFQIPVDFLNSSALPPHPSSITQSPFGSLTSSAIPLPLQTQSEPLWEETNLHKPTAVWHGAAVISEAGADYYGRNVSVSSKFKTEWGSGEQDGTQTRDVPRAPED